MSERVMQQLPFRMTAVESALSANIGECSIVAAEVNRKSHEMMQKPELIDTTQLYLFDRDGVETPDFATYNTVPLTDDTKLEDGRPVQFRLVQRPKMTEADEPPVLLCGIVRGSMAFPIASFTRRSNSYCDYVQIGDEMDNENLVVTPVDEVGSRKEVIDLINSALDVDPLTLRYKDVFKISDVEAHDEILAISGRSDSNRFLRAAMSKEDSQMVAIIRMGRNKGYISHQINSYMTDNYEDSVSKKRPLSHWKEMNALMEDMSTVPLDQITSGAFPGSQNPLGRKLLLREALSQRHIYAVRLGEAQTLLKRAGNALNLTEDIAERFGVYDERIEKLLAFSGKLAASAEAETSVIIEDMPMSGDSRADTELTVKAQKAALAGEYTLRLLVRPVALFGTDPIVAGEYMLNTFAANDHLEERDVAELADLVEIIK